MMVEAQTARTNPGFELYPWLIPCPADRRCFR